MTTEREPFADEEEFQQLIELHEMADRGEIETPEDGFLPPLTESEKAALLQELSDGL